MGALFAYDAWNNITFTAGEVVNPQRNLPASLLLGTTLVAAVYILINVAYVLNLPIGAIQHAAQDRVATAVAWRILGPPAEALMAAAILVATAGSDNGMILAGARVYYAMAPRRGLLRRRRTSEPPQRAGLQPGPAGGLGRGAGAFRHLQQPGGLRDLRGAAVSMSSPWRRCSGCGARAPRSRARTAPWATRWCRRSISWAATLVLASLLVEKPQYSLRGLAIVLAGLPAYAWWARAKAGR